MSEKLGSADPVEMGIDKHMVACLCRLETKAISMSSVSNSFSCVELTIHFPLCAEVRRGNGWMPSQIQFLPMI